MDNIVKDWLSGNPEPWQLLTGAVVLITLVAQRLASLRDTWFDFRVGRSKLLLEKQKFEILKLKYEIEAIRKNNQLPEIVPAPSEQLINEKAPAALPRYSPTWVWLTKHPIFGEIFLRLIQVFLVFYLVFSVAGLIAVPFVSASEPELKQDKWLPIVTALIYAMFAYGSYRAYGRVGVWIKDLRLTERIE